MNILQVENHEALLKASNYWDSEWNEKGLFYVSPNAGALRILCPRGSGQLIAEMRTGRHVVVTVGKCTRVSMPGMVIGREMAEFMFDDGSDTPYALNFSHPDQFERALPQAEDGRELVVSAWEGRRKLESGLRAAHQVLNKPGYLRFTEVPNMRPWPKTK